MSVLLLILTLIPTNATSANGLSAQQQAEIEQLEAIGYVSERPQKDAERRSKRGVTVHDASRTHTGLNLYSSGHGPVAVLIDMEGHVLHRWEHSAADLWPKAGAKKLSKAKFFRRARLFENGDLLVIFTGLGLVRLDVKSNVLWKSVRGAHHDLEVQPNGDIFVLARRARVVRWLNRKKPVLEDFVVITDSNGVEKRRVSVLEAFRGTPYRRFLRRRRGDVTHTNTIRVLDGSIAEQLPAFAAGNVLLSTRTNSILAVLDMSTEKIVWAKVGMFKLQHDPTLLENGNILLFDNGNARRNQSRALELDPMDMSIVWRYPGVRKDPFFTTCCGLAQRLPNDNTLIVSADTGRAVEVTRSGEIVWEFLTPHVHMGYVRTLFEFVRLPADFPTDWANAN